MKFKKLVAAVIATLTLITVSYAQVNVTGSIGADGTYTTLTDAFNAVNASGPHTGATIVMTLTASTNEGTATAQLNAGTWTMLTIRPAVGVAATVTGGTTGGSSLIKFNGADNVTIDGRNTGGSSLTVSNTFNGSFSGSGTIQFVEGATNNVVTNCTILGSYIGPIANNGGTILFGIDNITPDGNDNNTISNNNIGPAGTNLPSKAIYCTGSTSTTAKNNSGNIISGNTIYDYFVGNSSAGIYIGPGSTDWAIQNNKFYQSASRTLTSSTSIHSAIYFGDAAINNCLVSGNTIGYSSPSGTGTYTIISATGSTRFYPIYASALGSTIASTIQNNTITAISFSGTLTGPGTFTGIYITTGLVTISNNMIGSATVPAAISLSSTASPTYDAHGIANFSTQGATVTNNSIGGILVNNASPGQGVRFFCMRFSPSVSSSFNTVQNNTIGFSAAPVVCNPTANTSRLFGIYSTVGSSIITGNTVAFLYSRSSNTNSDDLAGLIGIYSENSTATAPSTISQNHVHSLSNTHPNAAVNVIGIFYNGNPVASGNIVSQNSIYSLSSVTTSTTTAIYGISILNSGSTTFSNNMISLGLDEAGASVSTGTDIYGIRENGGTNQFYFNSIYIGGSGVTGGGNTFAFYNSVTTGSRNIRNNIFYNARSNGTGTGTHCAIHVAGTTPNPPGLTSNYNVVFADGVGNAAGLYNGAFHPTLAAWQTAAGQDMNSVAGNPQFINPAGNNTTVDLHIITGFPIIEAAGTPIATVTTDYDGQIRAVLTPTDIGADAGNFVVFPVLGTYPNTTVTAGRNTTVTPTTAPQYLLSAVAYSTAKLDGILTVNPTTGIVNITDAMPAGTYTVTVKGFGAAGTVTTTFTLTVTNPTCSQGLFYGTGSVAVATYPVNIAIGDFNNDGKQDIASPSYMTSAVSIRLGDGLGGFSGTTEVPVGASPGNLAVADFNGDGKQDLAVTNTSTTTVSIRLGNGFGGFTGTTNVTVGTSPYGIAVGDFNNDGKFDIATTNLADATLSINLGDGLGGFGPQSLLATAGSPRSLQVGDFNEDGNQDIAVCCMSSNSVSIFLGNGAGAFTVQAGVSVSTSPGSLVLGDFNNDNHIDLATTSSGFFAASVRYGDGLGGFSGSTEIFIDMNSSYGDLAVGDFNSDGNSDLVITRLNTSEIAIQYGNGTGAFSGNTPFPSGGFSPHLPAVGDFNGDGIQDIAVANENDGNVAIRLGGTADINLVGNAVNIPDGSTVPLLTNGTDFGSREICGNSSLTQTFTFQNTGTTYLALSGVSITGIHSGDFIAYPSSFGLNPGGTQDIFVVFDPSAAGVRTATVHFTNTDCDENTYDFAVQGTGTDPEIDVRGNNISIADGSPSTSPSLTNHTDFGNQSVCTGTFSRTFKIFNTGTAILTTSVPALIGPQAADFSITSPPAASVNPGDSTSLTVTFNPSASGLRQAYLGMSNNDCSEPIYDFWIQGTGVDPEMNIKGNNTSIVDGDNTPSLTDFTNFGVACSGSVVKTFVIENSGTQSLSITGIIFAGTNASDFSVTTAPASTIATPGSSSFQVTFTPGATGIRNATLIITNSDCDEAIYNFAISGTGTTPVTGTTVVTNVSCFGGSNGTINLTPSGGSGGYTFNWLPSGPTTEDRTGLTAGTYSVQITDASGCTGTVIAIVTQPPAISVTASAQTNVSCFGGSNGAASINAATGGSGSFTYNWTPGNPTGDGTTSVSGLAAGTWTVTTTDLNGCTVANAFTVTQPPAISFTAAAQTNVSCFGGSNGAFTVNPALGGTGSFTYDWAPGNPAGDGTTSVTGLTSGTWTVTATDASGCSSIINFTITEPSAISFTAASQTNVSCFGGSNGTFTVNPALGGTGSFTYDWEPGTPTGDGTTSVTGLTAGTWTVTATDANGCSSSMNFTITEPSAISFTAASQTNVSCFGGSNGAFTVNPALGGTGSFTYDWEPGTPTGDGTTSVTGLTAGTWTVTATDANGCSSIINFTITEPSAISFTAAAQTNVSCFGGSNGAFQVNAALGGTGSFTYDWAPGNPTGDGTTAVTGLTAGTWTVTATDVNGCSAIINFTITEPPVLTSASVATSVACNGGSATVTVTASGGIAPYTGEGLFTVSAGTYTYTVSDANGCITTTSITVTEPSVLTASSTAAASIACNGGTADVTVVASGGTAPYTGEGSFTVTAGTYSYTVTDANGCTTSTSITVTEPTTLTSTSSATSIACNGGTADVTVVASGGTAPYTGEGSFTVTAGTYSYTVTDANGCTTTTSITVTEPTLLTASSSATSIACNGGTADVTVVASGGTTPYTGEGTFTVNAGTYSYTVTDANGCTTTTSITVTEPAILSAVINAAVNPTTCSGTDGAIDINASGGTVPYTFLWSNNDPNEDLTAVAADAYSVVITDANGCTTTVSATINDPGAPAVTLALPMDTACGSFPGTVLLSGESPAGGTWSGSNVSGNTFDPFTAGVGMHFIAYTYTDINGCTASATDSVYVDLCMGIETVTATSWNVFPNPTSGLISVTTTGELISDVIIEIYSADGKLIQSENKQQATTITLDLSDEPVGTYFIRIIANEQVSVRRVVKL